MSLDKSITNFNCAQKLGFCLMSITTKFNLKDFQSSVFKSYSSLRRQFDDIDTFSEKGASGLIRNPKLSFIRRNFLKFFILLRVYLYNFYLKSEQFVELEKKSVKIIENQAIKKILCLHFNRKLSSDCFKEEREVEVIIIVTELLTGNEMTEKYSIDKSADLFSLIIYKILKIGVENYCTV